MTSPAALPTPTMPPRPGRGNRPRAAAAPRLLEDAFGRVARDLRVSLTDRCNLRCAYCMPAAGLEWIPTPETLSDEETIRLITLAVERLGIRQVRFTGGEPLLRRSLPEIVAATKQLATDEDAPPETAITTNALGLDKKARRLKEAGLNRVNISLDTIDRENYARLTRRARLEGVFAGIDAALAAGLEPVKINSVVMPGINDGDVVELALFALERGLELRFIEQMPLGPPERWDRERMVTADDILDRLQERLDLEPARRPRGSAPAEVFRARDRKRPGVSGTIGVIASVSAPFCGDCDRTRLTTDGAVRSCLFASEETSLRDLMRAGASDEELAEAWAGAMAIKKPGHGIDDPSFVQPRRRMSAIGG
ncbi:GTP 3',8-cyclase MoaA [Corynebacterium otitidis]|uniref:GTP 3',8-cyclase MoaA n=1 Tax=Corynebacterium otitidis TaxID=29321 RepID=UPI000627578B|nr:GTP 3',8-cyclase MoaA [Corynebacterium otitidis]KKO84388.1 molybdenum cofactor biosynthesis protein MoeA [Corynebacterium otitidis]